MRVFQFITRLDPGGAEHQLLQLSNGLVSRGFEVYVGYFKGRGSLTKSFERVGCRVIRIAGEGAGPFGSMNRAASTLRRVKPNVVHAHLPKAEVFGAIAGRIAGVPRIISTKHNDEPYWLSPRFRWSHQVVSRLYDVILVPSNHLKTFTASVGCHPPTLVVPYGIDADQVAAAAVPARTAVIRARFARGARYVVGFIGRLEPQKGLFDFVAASNLIRRDDVAFVIVGDGSLKSKLACQSRVRLFPGSFEIPSVLKALDLLVLPSHWEGFGMILLESMACGVPIIATNASSIPEVLGEGKAGVLVPPRSPEILAKEIDRLLEDDVCRVDLSKAGWVWVREHFSVDRMLGGVLGAYDSRG